jgi:hypothetical protein
MMRAHHPVLLVLGGLAVLAASFFVTLFLLRNGIWIPGDDPAEQLARLNAHDASELEQAAARAGLKKSDAIVGWIDRVSRGADGRLNVSGWAADGLGDGKPISIAILLNGRVLLRMNTKGSEDKVKAYLQGVGFGRPEVAQNVLAEGVSEKPVSCSDMNRLLTVGISNRGEFRRLGSNAVAGC